MAQEMLYVIPMPEDAQIEQRRTERSDVTEMGTVGQTGSPVSETIRSNPRAKRITGEFRGHYAKVMAEELEQLFSATAVRHVPYFGVDDDFDLDRTGDEGYYSLKNINVRPADPRNDTGAHYKWEGQIVRKGTQNRHWRAIKTSKRGVDHEFGNDLSLPVFIPVTAEKVRWFDGDSEYESAEASESCASEFIDVDGYDAEDSSYANPTLLYELPYTDEGKADVKVWDTFDRAKDGDEAGVSNTWMHVWDPSYEFDGSIIVDNGCIRVEFVESPADPSDGLTFYTYDDGTDEWTETSLPSSDWRVFDVDFTRIGEERTVARLLFEDTAGSTLFELDAIFHSGWDGVQFDNPDPNDQGPIPVAVEDELEPLASPIDEDPSESKTLVKRSDVRKTVKDGQ